MKNAYIVIAAYNEQKNIPRTIAELKKHGYRNIIVVDDGSNDKTSYAASTAGATILQHVINRGQGAALRTGIEYSLRQGADVIVTFDADGQHKASDISAMIKPILNGTAEVTVGSRFIGARRRKIPLRRKILLKGSVLVMWFFYGIKMTDAHNGLRALSRNAAQKIEITCDRMAHASEIIEEIHNKKILFQEVPVTIRYTKDTMRRGHGSYIGALKILWQMILDKVMR